MINPKDVRSTLYQRLISAGLYREVSRLTRVKYLEVIN